jgi:hypothetical protein
MAAIDCMVCYIYEAGYNVSSFPQCQPLLHAQVAIIADKCDCASLYKLAKTLFVDTVLSISPKDWAITAAFVYDYTTTESSAHVELRNAVVAAVAGRQTMLRPTLQEVTVIDLLRSNADLATDLLMGGQYGSKADKVSESHFICEHCQYSHAGLRSCPLVTPVKTTDKPICGNLSHHTQRVYTSRAFPCHSCDGHHTIDPDDVDIT